MKTIFIHRFAGVLSAYGLGLSNLVYETQVRPRELWLAASISADGIRCYSNRARSRTPATRWPGCRRRSAA